ncbi:MAG: hypothetical protein ACTSRO_05880 [Candidatus Heimdallarchaeaceae archaeon]
MPKLILVILGLLFLYVSTISLQKLYPFLKISKELEERLEKSAFIVTIIEIVLTILTSIVFAILVSDSTDWDFGTTFYTGLLGGIVVALLLWFAKKEVKVQQQ